MRAIVKRFGAFVAVDGVDLDVAEGEVHALLGENGAGKSTLVKILYGLLAPTEGEVFRRGERIVLPSPEAARALGIGMVFQHFSLFDNLTVAENIALVMPRETSLRGLDARIDGLAGRYGVRLDPGRQVSTLSAGERQRIEIARCLLQDPTLLILDEPTSVLTPQEAETLFLTLDALKAEGRAILYITHKLDEVRHLCDRATILRRGRVVATCDPRVETARSMAALMVGAQIGEIRPAASHALGRVALELSGLDAPSTAFHGVSLVGVSLAVRGGEIVGVAGVAGNGQAELFAALSGETASRDAAVLIQGTPVGRRDVNARRRLGAAFVPEERNGHAAAPDFTLSENAVLSRHATGGLTHFGFVLAGAAQRLAASIVARFDVRRSGADPVARTLSGGNLQKFVVGREILREPTALVVDQPTWGVDALAAAAIRQALVDLAGRGAAVLVVSQDLDELFEIADRIAVIHDGRLSEARPVATTTREAVGLMMAGAPAQETADAA